MSDLPNSAEGSGLGKATQYSSTYDASLLYPIARKLGRDALGLEEPLPFTGEDVWTGWELSWLNERGLPQVAVAEFVIPATSANIIESKSFKLYLNSFNQTRFEHWQQVQEILTRDLSAAAGAPVVVTLMKLTEAEHYFARFQFESQGRVAECLDELPVSIEQYTPNPELLKPDTARAALGETAESLVSHLLKTNCPVTGQPDWASIWIDYRGSAIDKHGLLAYLVSFREHQDFHEQCVERCFMDILQRCKPVALTVYARYTRRGGLDINPFRSTHLSVPTGLKLIRQ